MTAPRAPRSRPLDVLPNRSFASAAEAKEYRILRWTERELQDHVVSVAQAMGWLVYHTHDSRRSQPGFPDLVLCHATRGTIYRELKTEKGRLRPAQAEWIIQLTLSGQDAGVWRPSHVVDGLVDQVLSGRTK